MFSGVGALKLLIDPLNPTAGAGSSLRDARLWPLGRGNCLLENEARRAFCKIVGITHRRSLFFLVVNLYVYPYSLYFFFIYVEVYTELLQNHRGVSSRYSSVHSFSLASEHHQPARHTSNDRPDGAAGAAPQAQ
jgi:hypothetical protein